MTNWPISTEHNRRKDRKGLIMIKHPVTKNSAKEDPQNLINYLPNFQAPLHIYFYNFPLLSFTFDFSYVL